jgi:phosphatidylserine decarboxylase
MTPFDVHKNCSPIDGRIILSKHISGSYHSLKEYIAMIENERHTYIISNNRYSAGIVQIASRRVRRIDSYVKEGQYVKKGEWIGMIRFGSQVDVFLPIEAKINIVLKQQVYAKKSIIAEIE